MTCIATDISILRRDNQGDLSVLALAVVVVRLAIVVYAILDMLHAYQIGLLVYRRTSLMIQD